MHMRQLHTTRRNKAQTANAATATEPLAVTVKETQRLLSCCHVTVYKLVGAKKLVALKLGRRTLITMESVNRLLAALPEARITTQAHT